MLRRRLGRRVAIDAEADFQASAYGRSGPRELGIPAVRISERSPRWSRADLARNGLRNRLTPKTFGPPGVVAERLKAAVLKTAKGESPS
jgi:hypothetical protein